MQKIWFYLYRFAFKKLIGRYIRRDTRLRFDGLQLLIRKGVFHPRFFFSSRYMYRYLQEVPLKDKTFLEVGSGSGLLSLLAFRKGARVHAVDIDPAAVDNTKENFQLNFPGQNGYSILQSDLFSQLGTMRFDSVVVNPPYYFKAVETSSQHAWHCGENGEYFERFFAGIKTHTHGASQVLMVLSDACDLGRIQSIARGQGLKLLERHSKKILWEQNFIFAVVPET